TIIWRRLPMMTQILKQSPSIQLMKQIMDFACAAEAKGRVLNASVFAGFPLADIACVGLSIVLVADKSKVEDARKLLDELTAMAWRHRGDFMETLPNYEDSLSEAAALTEGPVLLVDHGDNCASGGTTDEMSVLRKVIE